MNSTSDIVDLTLGDNDNAWSITKKNLVDLTFSDSDDPPSLATIVRARGAQGKQDAKTAETRSPASAPVTQKLPRITGAKVEASSTAPPKSQGASREARLSNGESGSIRHEGSPIHMETGLSMTAKIDRHVNGQKRASTSRPFTNHQNTESPTREHVPSHRLNGITSKSKSDRPAEKNSTSNGRKPPTSEEDANLRDLVNTFFHPIVGEPKKHSSVAKVPKTSSNNLNGRAASEARPGKGTTIKRQERRTDSPLSLREVSKKSQTHPFTAVKEANHGSSSARAEDGVTRPGATERLVEHEAVIAVAEKESSSRDERPKAATSQDSRHPAPPSHLAASTARLEEKLFPPYDKESVNQTVINESQGEISVVKESTFLGADVGPKKPSERGDATTEEVLVGDGSAMEVDEFSWLDSAASAESILEEHVRTLRRDHSDLVKSCLFQARSIHLNTTSNQTNVQGSTQAAQLSKRAQSPFSNIVGFGTHGAKTEKTTTRISFKSQSYAKQLPRHKEHKVSVYDSTEKFIPPYTSLLTLRLNFNVENDKKLISWPYLELSDKERRELDKELSTRYLHGNPDQRINAVSRAQHINHEQSTVRKFLSDFHCQPSHIITYLLRPTLDLDVETPLDQIKAWRQRDNYFKGGRIPDRTSIKWALMLLRQPRANTNDLFQAAVACAAFDKVSEFGLWHYVKSWMHSSALLPASAGGLSTSTQLNYLSLACRVCQVHNCPYHGEVTEQAIGLKVNDEDEENSLDGDLDRDDLEPSDINHLQLVKAPAEIASSASVGKDFSHDPEKALQTILREGRQNSASAKPNLGKKGWHYWTHNSRTADIHGRQPFYPCNHKGSCEDAQCRCFREQITCEKTCCCSVTCERRFRGCSCSKTQKACYKNAKCDCWQLGRECDPDMCGSCGAAEVLAPANRYEENATHGKCWNVGLQRNVPKRTKIGRSAVSGYGLFAVESIKRDEYIGEYKGEVITQGEADRRGSIHHYQPRAYLSQMNQNQESDGTHAGCKMRFLNNSSKDPGQNCYRALLLTGSVTRMAIFARRDVKAGEELFFDYGYAEKEKKRKRFREPEIDESIHTTIFKAKKRKLEKKKAKRRLNRTDVEGILGEPGIAMTDLEGDSHEDSAWTHNERSGLDGDDVDSSDSVRSDEDEEFVLGLIPARPDEESDDDSDYHSSTSATGGQSRKRGRKRKESV